MSYFITLELQTNSNNYKPRNFPKSNNASPILFFKQAWNAARPTVNARQQDQQRQDAVSQQQRNYCDPEGGGSDDELCLWTGSDIQDRRSVRELRGGYRAFQRRARELIVRD